MAKIYSGVKGVHKPSVTGDEVVEYRVGWKECFTKKDILDWLQRQDDNAMFCPHCLGVMKSDGTFFRCENKMCLFKEWVADGKISKEINHEINQERGREVLDEMKENLENHKCRF
jgi:hypothetical protein